MKCKMELHAQRRGEQTWRKRCLRRWYWCTLTLMLVAVERKPTMAHGGYDGGGQCLMQFFFFFPVQRHQPLFFSFLVCFCLVLLLLVSGEGGAAGGFQTVRWRLLWGATVAAVERKNNGGSPFSCLLPL